MQYEQIRYERSFWFLAVLMIGLALFWPGEVLAQTFNNPGGTSGGVNYGIDICRNWGTNCGQPAADLFCKNRSLGNATQFSFRQDSPPTWVMGDSKWCGEGFCDRFGSITCGPPGTTFHTTYAFDNPTTRDYNDKVFGIDICLNWGTNCGQPAADRYCRDEGYRSATQLSFRQDSPPTWVQGDNQTCSEGFCDRFQRITCTR
jgi:hypothetical protein